VDRDENGGRSREGATEFQFDTLPKPKPGDLPVRPTAKLNSIKR